MDPRELLSALSDLPKEMTEGSRRAGTVERECVDIVEAALLTDRVGEEFEACVVDVDERRPGVGTVQLVDPAVIGRVESPSPLPLGERLRVRLTQADLGEARVSFAPV